MNAVSTVYPYFRKAYREKFARELEVDDAIVSRCLSAVHVDATLTALLDKLDYCQRCFEDGVQPHF